MRLTNQIAFITGGGRGIGRAMALGFAREGAHLVVAARTQAEVEAVAEEVRSARSPQAEGIPPFAPRWGALHYRASNRD